MAYIQDQNHFRNYIDLIMRENIQNLDENQFMPIGQYVHTAWEFADSFSWSLRNDPTLLHEDKFWEWIKFKKVQGFSIPVEIDHIMTDEFSKTMEDLYLRPGVYSFWNKNNVCLYVGVSVDLSSRIITSFTERFKHYVNVVNLRYISTKTRSDASVLETILIAKLKPILNTTGKFDDDFTFDFDIPELSHPIPCNKEGEKVHIRISNSNYETRLNIDGYSEELEVNKDQKPIKGEEIL